MTSLPLPELDGPVLNSPSLVPPPHLRALLDACSQGVYFLDTAGICVYANPAAGELLGYDLAQLVGVDLHTLIHHSRADGSPWPAQDCPQMQVAMLGVAAEGKDQTLWRADGTLLAVDYRVRPVIVDGQVAGAVAMLIDATVRRAALAQLLGILDTAGDAFVSIGPDLTINGWNNAAQALLGWTASEAVGRDLIATIVAPPNRQPYGEGLRRLFQVDDADMPQGRVEITVLHKDGRQIWVELALGRMRWAGQWRFHAFLHDITDRRAAAQSLAHSEALHRLLAENSGDLISRHAADGRLLYVSPAAHTVLGTAPEQLIGRNPLELVHPNDVATLLQAEVMRDAHAPRRELTFRLRHRDGHWVWAEALPSVLRDADGAIAEILMCIRDITDRKARDAEQHQESKLESLGRLSAGLAHEINSPIQFVGDNARFLAEAYQDLMRIVLHYREMLESPHPIEWDERLAQVRAAEDGVELDYLQAEIPSAVAQTLEGIDRVATLVRAMKTFSHPGHKQQAPADLNEALAATATVSRHQVSTVADLVLDLGELPSVHCNIADLNQVFLNLIINAADAIEETGRRGRIIVTTAVDGDHAVVSISDTGTGIPEDVRPKIFDPFFTTKDVGRGSGQGLHLARAVVREGHGGQLNVDSAPGSGSTFTIRLPINGRAETNAAT